jgi:hypothetical protein
MSKRCLPPPKHISVLGVRRHKARLQWLVQCPTCRGKRWGQANNLRCAKTLQCNRCSTTSPHLNRRHPFPADWNVLAEKIQSGRRQVKMPCRTCGTPKWSEVAHARQGIGLNCVACRPVLISRTNTGQRGLSVRIGQRFSNREVVEIKIGGGKQRLRMRCDKGHLIWARPNDVITKGTGCGPCKARQRGEKKRVLNRKLVGKTYGGQPILDVRQGVKCIQLKVRCKCGRVRWVPRVSPAPVRCSRCTNELNGLVRRLVPPRDVVSTRMQVQASGAARQQWLRPCIRCGGLRWSPAKHRPRRCHVCQGVLTTNKFYYPNLTQKELGAILESTLWKRKQLTNLGGKK